MPKSLAYLVGAKVTPYSEQRGCKPRPEFDLFIERTGAALLDYAYLEKNGSAAEQTLRRQHKAHIALGMCVASQLKKYKGVVVSGEDVGLPLIAFSQVRGCTTPIYIITHGSYFGSAKFRALMSLYRCFKNVH